MEIFYRALGVMIEWPWLALLPAVILLVLHVRTRRPSVLVAGLAWVAYCLYESGMKLRILCSGECNIRIDLLLIYPALVVLSLLALARAWLTLRAGRARP